MIDEMRAATKSDLIDGKSISPWFAMRLTSSNKNENEELEP